MEAHLENWYIMSTTYDYLPPEAQSMFLVGIVTNHHRLPDGMKVETSIIKDIDTNSYEYAQTKNSKYTLGKPDLKWVNYLLANGFSSGQVLARKLFSEPRMASVNESE